MNRRRLIGWIAVDLLVGALAISWWQPTFFQWQPMAAAFSRVGVLMAVLWLAYPDLQAIPSWMWGGFIIALVIVAARPKAAIFVVPMLGLFWFLKRLGNPT